MEVSGNVVRGLIFLPLLAVAAVASRGGVSSLAGAVKYVRAENFLQAAPSALNRAGFASSSHVKQNPQNQQAQQAQTQQAQQEVLTARSPQSESNPRSSYFDDSH